MGLDGVDDDRMLQYFKPWVLTHRKTLTYNPRMDRAAKKFTTSFQNPDDYLNLSPTIKNIYIHVFFSTLSQKYRTIRAMYKTARRKKYASKTAACVIAKIMCLSTRQIYRIVAMSHPKK